MIDEALMKKLLFICPGNDSRSQIAEALAGMHGGTMLEPYSAGPKPASAVSVEAVEFMLGRGYDLTAHFPKSFADIPSEEFDVAVAMDGEGAYPQVRAKRWLTWNIPDPKPLTPQEFQEMGTLIEDNVHKLLQSL